MERMLAGLGSLVAIIIGVESTLCASAASSCLKGRRPVTRPSQDDTGQRIFQTDAADRLLPFDSPYGNRPS